MADSRFLTPADAAAELPVKVDAIYGWINSGELKATNVAATRNGRPTWRIRRSDWEQFLAARESRPPVAPAPRQRRRRADRFADVPKVFRS